MFGIQKLKNRISWPLLRAHLCTLAVAVSFNSTWRVPRDSFRYGGLTYAMVFTVAMATAALPVTLLQLAVGQLSQQDAVGVWRAVPFFKGIGYIRLLVSFIGSIYTVVQVALLMAYFLYTINNSIPFSQCSKLVVTEDGYQNLYNGTMCINETFLAPAGEQPEYFTAVSLVIIVLWIVFPFLLFTPVKMMKRIFYALGPLVLMLGVVIMFNTGHTQKLSNFYKREDWCALLRPAVWFAAITQALLSSQVSGGFLISAGDTIYANTDVQCSALAIVGANLLAGWAGLLFWFSMSSGDNDSSSVSVLVQTYQAAEENQLGDVWPLLAFAALFFSGIITMLTHLFPIYDRIRRIGGHKWRIACIILSAVSAAIALATLAGRLPALALLEDITIPLLVTIATVLEIVAFVFVYGWKFLVEDIEFLTGGELVKYWMWGWCAAPGIILPFALWWLVVIIIESRWTEPYWDASVLCAVATLSFFVIITSAAVAVIRQVQYDFIGKLKSSFQPSRHWGPRDPITHYYWLASREEAARGSDARIRYHRRHLGQLSGRSSCLHTIEIITDTTKVVEADKTRSYSDDWLYTVYRRKYLKDVLSKILNPSKRRSRSLDWVAEKKSGTSVLFSNNKFNTFESLDFDKENNNNVIDVKNFVIDSVTK